MSSKITQTHQDAVNEWALVQFGSPGLCHHSGGQILFSKRKYLRSIKSII